MDEIFLNKALCEDTSFQNNATMLTISSLQKNRRQKDEIVTTMASYKAADDNLVQPAW
jgi:hypothetical protein